MLLDLIRAGIAIHSPHTAFDSAAAGINQQLAEGLGLTDIQPLEPCSPPLRGEFRDGVAGYELGAGRFGRLTRPLTLIDLAARLKQFLKISGLHMVGQPQTQITQAAVACGSAGEFLGAAIERGCQVLITGETRLHTCYEAEARGIALLLAGHYASERFGVESLAQIIAAQFPAIAVWPSQGERDPLVWL
jgi:putative NIF3 family GTP cyclohydrolase 1 type 2